jgi:guanine nucleotide-binding protein G(i) subunit alpha
LKKEAKLAGSIIKLLILGSGESGKSTVLKQIGLINTSTFSASERHAHIAIIRSNTKEAIDAIVSHSRDSDESTINTKQLEDLAYLRANQGLVPDLANLWDAIESVWQSEQVRKFAVEHRNEFHLTDSAIYFLDRVGKIRQVDYLPSDQDILRSRCVTNSITDTSFTHNNVKFRIFDAGGQRHQRRKWIQCFDNVTAIIFVVDIGR